jgi:CHAT domain-containing protein
MRNLLAVLALAGLPCVSPAAWGKDDNPAYLELTGRFFHLIEVAEKRLASGEQPTATLLGPLCIAYLKVKAYTKLFECTEKLQARVAAGDRRIKHLWFTVSDADATPIPDLLRAEAYLDLGEYERSAEAGRRALTLIKGDGYDGSFWPPVKYRLTILGNLVVATALAGKQQEALDLLQKLQDVSIPFKGRSNWVPVRDIALARAFMATGQYDRVLDALKSNVFDRVTLSISNAASHAGWVNKDDSIKTIFELPKLFMLGKSQLELGRSKDAKSTFDKLLANPRVEDVGDIHRLALYERGRIAAAEENLPDAVRYWMRAVELLEQQRSSLNSEANKIGFVGDKQAVYQRLIEALVALQRHADAFMYLERSKSRALVDMLAKQQEFASAEIDASALKALLSKAGEAELQSISLEVRAQLSTQRTLTVAAARDALANAAPELASLVSVSFVPIDVIQSHLSSDEVLVEYYYRSETLYIFVLTKEDVRATTVQAPALESDVRELRKAIEQTKTDAYLAPARRLYDVLIRPVEPLFGKSQVVVVPHGALHYLPFATLHDGEGFLVDKFALRFLPSASVLKYLRSQRTQKSAGILAFGNPDLGNPQHDLKFAEQEALAVVRTIPQSRALLRLDANVSALKRYAGGFRYLHFATHGQFDASTPLQSALFLSKEGEDDGRLTVAKLYTMRLDADLVALSACETGIGKIASGDDVIGLTRGFLYAGASTIVASLWKVDDEATSVLMTSFYERFKGENKLVALREAQLAARAKFPHPFYWAPFQLTGNAR